MSNPQVELHIAGYGVVTLELDQDKAPKTVANFLQYVEAGHYAGTVFHRVIPNFMAQGGGYDGESAFGRDERDEDDGGRGWRKPKPHARRAG